MKLKSVLLAATMLTACGVMGAKADVTDLADLDPLHLCTSTGCAAFAGVTIGTPDSLSNVVVTSSPASQSGDLIFALLIPNNESQTVPVVTGTLNGNPLTIGPLNLGGIFSAGQFLTNILGITGTPPNPFSAYSGATAAFDPTFTNYDVYTAAVGGTFTTGPNAGQTSNANNLFDFVGGAPAGSILTAFLCPDESLTGCITTAQSSSLVTGGTPSAVPEASTWTMMFTGFALLGFAAYRRQSGARLAA